MRKLLFSLALIGAFGLAAPVAAHAASYPKIGKTSCSDAVSYFNLGAPYSESDAAGFKTISYKVSPWSDQVATTPIFNIYCGTNGLFAGVADVNTPHFGGSGTSN